MYGEEDSNNIEMVKNKLDTIQMEELKRNLFNDGLGDLLKDMLQRKKIMNVFRQNSPSAPKVTGFKTNNNL